MDRSEASRVGAVTRYTEASVSSFVPVIWVITNSYSFDRSVLEQQTLGDQYRYILTLNTTYDKIPKELRELVLNMLDKMVQLCYNSTLYEQDGETLVLIACNHRDYDWLLNK